MSLLQKVHRARLTKGVDQVVVRVLSLGVQVVSERALEEGVLLGDDGDPGPVPGQVHPHDVALVDDDAPFHLFHHSEEHHGDGGLAGARPPHDGHLLAAPDSEADVLQTELTAPVNAKQQQLQICS